MAWQYILLTHGVLDECFIERPVEEEKSRKWAEEQWPIWIEGLKRLAVEYDVAGDTVLACMARDAQGKLELYDV